MPQPPLSPQELLAAYAAGPDQLEQALAGMTETDLDRPPADGGWTIRQVVHHLADGESILSIWLKMALTTPGSSFPMTWYPGNDEWAQALDYSGRAIAPALTLFRANRLYVTSLVEHLISRWEQPIDVLFRGADRPMSITVGGIIGLWVRHLQEHLDQMAACRL